MGMSVWWTRARSKARRGRVRSLDLNGSPPPGDRYRLFFEGNPDAMVVLDPSTLRFLDANQAAVELYGYSKSEFLTLSLLDIRPSDEMPRLFAALEGRVRRAPVMRSVMRNRRKSGTFIQVEANTARVRLEGREVLLAIVREVPALERSVASSSSDEEVWRALLENSLDYFIIVDEEDRVRFINRPLAGYEVHEILGHRLTELSVADEQAGVHRDLAKVRRTGQPLVFETPARRADGGVTWYEGRCVPVKRDDRVPLVLVICTDITERRLQAAELRKTKELAEAANRSKDQFIAALSHELRTPLTPVLAAISSIAVGCPDLLPMTSMIKRNIELEARLIDDLLDVGRIVSGKFELCPEDVDVHSLIVRTLEICRPDIAGKSHDLRVDLSAPRHWTRADPARLQQVLWNIIKNAVKFTPSCGTIYVRSYQMQDKLVLEVTDSGEGISREDLGRIFRPFEQLSHNRRGGLGLGLAISKAIVDASGGSIVAESKGRGCGATFRLEIPANVEPIRKPHTDGEAPKPGPAKSLRVLLVEDDPDTRETLAALLRACRHQVTTADSIASAEEHAGCETFDLLISDIGLPDGSGLDLMAKLRPRLRIRGIALSGYGTADDVQRSKIAGFSAHLTKPVSFERLKGAIEETGPAAV
jgi:PAS domain S-box-containing protein